MPEASPFPAILKGLSDKNTEKEKETKLSCEAWISERISQGELSLLEEFFDYLRQEIEQAHPGSNLLLGAINAFGIFAHGIKGNEKLQETYLPIILELFIATYASNDTCGKTKKVVSSNLLSVILVSQHLVFPVLPKIFEIVFRMKKDQAPDIVTFSSKIDEVLCPLIKNDAYRDSYRSIDLEASIKFMCANFKLSLPKINLWVLSWFNVFLSIESLDLVRHLPSFFKELLARLSDTPSEAGFALEKFLKDLRAELSKKSYIKDRAFCAVILRQLTDSADLASSKKKIIETFRWIQEILSVQLSSEFMVSSQQEIEANYDVHLMEDIRFEDIISDVLLFTLQCLNSQDEQTKSIALKTNDLLQERILDVVSLTQSQETKATFLKIFTTLQKMISSESLTTYYAMKWMENLIDKFPSELVSLSEKILDNLKNDDIRIVEISVVLIAKIVEKMEGKEEGTALIADVISYLEGANKKEKNQAK